MDENISTSIPSAMRPSKSLIAHVKSTLSDLVSSVFKRSKAENQSDNKKEDSDEIVDKTKDKPIPSDDMNSSLHSIKIGNVSPDISRSLSKSQQIRTKEAYQQRLKSFTVGFF